MVKWLYYFFGNLVLETVLNLRILDKIVKKMKLYWVLFYTEIIGIPFPLT
jgi:hypothetical protein